MQDLLDLEDNNGFGSNPKSWLSGNDLSRTLSSLSAAAAAASATGNVDRVLFNDLVEMVPLVQSLIDRKANSSFTRRGSVIYTKTPSRESLYKRTAGRNGTKKHGDCIQDNCADNYLNFSSKNIISETDKEELVILRDQVDDLRRQLSEKDELLNSMELSQREMSSIQMKLDEVRNEAAEKDSTIKSSQLQLSDLKIKLANERAAVEKLQWEATTSKEKAEKLQEDLDRVQREISAFMLLLEGLTNDIFPVSGGDYDDIPYPIGQNDELVSDLKCPLNSYLLDRNRSYSQWGSPTNLKCDVLKKWQNEMDMQKVEATRKAYVAAVAAAKEQQDEVSLSAAANARLHLQSILLTLT